MSVTSSKPMPGGEAPLSIDAIEERLVAAALHYHAEEANIARWLLEVDSRGLYRERGFSSLGDYAQELLDISPRKAQYLVFIASRLSSLPLIAEAFDSGDLKWTQAREIVRVATRENELEWLEKARALKSRDLEKAVKRAEGRDGSDRATLTISLPAALLETWTDCYELAERVSGCDLEKFQVLEPMMAEFLATYLPGEPDGVDSIHATDDEKDIPPEVRVAVLERDGYECIVPGCSMRKMLDLHHLKFRSRGGDHHPDNIVCICRIHHGLIHRGICELTGTVGRDLTFERPRLFTEKPPDVVTVFSDSDSDSDSEPESEPEPESELGPESAPDSDPWREETVAAIFDGPPTERRTEYRGDPITAHARRAQRLELEARAARRRRDVASRAGRTPTAFGDEHVFAETNTCSSGSPGRVGRSEASFPRAVGGTSGVGAPNATDSG